MRAGHQVVQVFTAALVAIAAAAGVSAQRPPAPPIRPGVVRGVDAYHRGDFATAFAILKPIVYDHAGWDDREPEPFAAFYLARMIERGEGVERDRPLACAIYKFAADAFMMRYDERDPNVRLALAASFEACRGMSAQETDEIGALVGNCFLDGVTRTEFALDNGNWLVVDRTGAHAAVDGRITDTSIFVAGCGSMVLGVEHTEIAPPPGTTTPPRHFLELFTSVSGRRNAHISRELTWSVYEIVGGQASFRLREVVARAQDTPYPAATLTPEIRALAELRRGADGCVHWTIRSDPPRSGIAGLSPCVP